MKMAYSFVTKANAFINLISLYPEKQTIGCYFSMDKQAFGYPCAESRL